MRAWKAAGWSGNSRSCALGAFSRMIRALVEPCWAAMRLPSMSLMPRILLPFLTRNCAPVTKNVMEKSTLSRRVRVSVMVPAIRSTALEVRRGMRVGGVDSFFSILMVLLSFFSMAGLTSSSTRSMEKPTHSFLAFTYAKGGEPVRVPMMSVPVWLMRSRVPCAWVWASAGVTVDASRARATTNATNLLMHSLLGGLVRQDLGEEILGTIGAGSREELLRRGRLHHSSFVHEDDPVGDATGEAHLVRHHHHGHAVLGEIGHDVQDLVDHLGVEGGGRLVEEHDARLHGQRPRDGHPLLLSAGKIGGMAVSLVGNAHAGEEIAGDLRRLGAGQSLDLHGGEGDVLQHRHVREEIEGLEDHADLGAELGQVPAVAGNGVTVHEDLALLDRLEPVDAADEGALARAGGPAHHHHLAGRDVEAHVLEHVVGAEPLAYADVANGRSATRHGLLDHHEHVTGIDSLPALHADVLDRARHRGLELVLHLHRLEDDQPIARAHRLPDRHFDEHDPSRHGRAEYLTARARSAAARADDVARLLLHTDDIGLAPHVDEIGTVLLHHVRRGGDVADEERPAAPTRGSRVHLERLLAQEHAVAAPATRHLHGDDLAVELRLELHRARQSEAPGRPARVHGLIPVAPGADVSLPARSYASIAAATMASERREPPARPPGKRSMKCVSRRPAAKSGWPMMRRSTGSVVRTPLTWYSASARAIRAMAPSRW